MKTSTVIAIVIAVVVVVVVFVYPGLISLKSKTSANETPVATCSASDQISTASTTMNTNADGLQIGDNVVGTGSVAQPGDTVTVTYIGELSDGTVFDASSRHPDSSGGFTFALGQQQVIPGWDEGIVGMKECGDRTLIVPPSLAYGANGIPGTIPPNATLTFHVKLLKVTPAGS